MSDSIFHLIISGKASSVENLILGNKKVVNMVDGMGRTPLMEAVIQRKPDICRMLISAGGDVNVREAKKWTALHFAAQEYDYDIAKILISNGAEVDAEDSDGNTPLFRCLFGAKGRGEVIELLLKSGADKNHKNKSGVSAWDLAQQVSSHNLKQYFLPPSIK